MGVIRTSTTNIHGEKKETEVHTNRFEDILLEGVYKVLGRSAGWKLAHRIERRKLKK